MAGSPPGSLRVAYLFTRFPHLTETFLQREVRAMRRLGVDAVLFSLHRGGGVFDGVPVLVFSKWSLLRLFWLIPVVWFRKPAVVNEIAREVFLGAPRDWMNHWENLYGAGIAVVWAGEFQRVRADHVHAVWATLPAMVAWSLSRLTGIKFSMGAHAYDMFEHGGDWFLLRKCAAAAFVHTSTQAGRRRLLQVGVPESRVIFARRGMDEFPPCRALRANRKPLRLVCISRLVEKKGLLAQLAVFQSLRARGAAFSVRVIGAGPLRSRLEAEIRSRQLAGVVTLVGAVPQEAVWRELAQADVLVHTGVVAPSGDRDGLPNVVPEAMAAGVLVLTTPADGVLEAIQHEVTGLVCAPADIEAWVAALARIADDDAFADRIRLEARAWVEFNFDAVANARLILAGFQNSIATAASDSQPTAPYPECDDDLL